MFFRPDMYCLVTRDDGEVAPLISKERLETMFDGIIFIISITIIPYIIFVWIKTIVGIAWTFLTPGQEWWEIFIIMLGISLLAMGKFVFDELTNTLIKKFNDLRRDSDDKEKIIVELNKKIVRLNNEVATLNKKVVDLEKKTKEIKNINVVEPDVNAQ